MATITNISTSTGQRYEQARRPLISYPLIRTVYRVLALVCTLAQLPLWAVYYALSRRLRPVPAWTVFQSVMNRAVSASVHTDAATLKVTPFPLNAGREGEDRWEVIRPPADHGSSSSSRDVYRDILLVDDNVRPATVGGVWHPKKPAPANPKAGNPAQATILHFHGGAFTLGTCRDVYAGYAGATLAKHVAPQVLMAGYRLASTDRKLCRFPAALQDAVTCYEHLLTVKNIPGSRIILSGDSAGANLAVALLRYITEHPDLYPPPSTNNDSGSSNNSQTATHPHHHTPPAAILLWSPWVDLTAETTLASNFTRKPHFRTDYIPTNFPSWGASNYAGTGPHAHDPGSAYISPLYSPFLAPHTPIFLQIGSAELLYEDALEFVRRYKEVCGSDGGGDDGDQKKGKKEEENTLELHVVPDANHDILLIGHLIGRKKEAVDAALAAHAFLDRTSGVFGT
jgi:acetyl esterase/lipase